MIFNNSSIDGRSIAARIFSPKIGRPGAISRIRSKNISPYGGWSWYEVHGDAKIKCQFTFGSLPDPCDTWFYKQISVCTYMDKTIWHAVMQHLSCICRAQPKFAGTRLEFFFLGQSSGQAEPFCAEGLAKGKSLCRPFTPNFWNAIMTIVSCAYRNLCTSKSQSGWETSCELHRDFRVYWLLILFYLRLKKRTPSDIARDQRRRETFFKRKQAEIDLLKEKETAVIFLTEPESAAYPAPGNTASPVPDSGANEALAENNRAPLLRFLAAGVQ